MDSVAEAMHSKANRAITQKPEHKHLDAGDQYYNVKTSKIMDIGLCTSKQAICFGLFYVPSY